GGGSGVAPALLRCCKSTGWPAAACCRHSAWVGRGMGSGFAALQCGSGRGGTLQAAMKTFTLRSPAIGPTPWGSAVTITIKDVAREAKVSVASVSRALNGNGGAPGAPDPPTGGAPARLRYVPHGAARSLITRRTH